MASSKNKIIGVVVVGIIIIIIAAYVLFKPKKTAPGQKPVPKSGYIGAGITSALFGNTVGSAATATVGPPPVISTTNPVPPDTSNVVSLTYGDKLWAASDPIGLETVADSPSTITTVINKDQYVGTFFGYAGDDSIVVQNGTSVYYIPYESDVYIMNN